MKIIIFFKYLYSIFFLLIVLCEVRSLLNKELKIADSHILLIVIIITLIFYRSKMSLFSLFAICLYGILDFFISTHKNDPSIMDFTSAVYWLIPSQESFSVIRRITLVYPLFFYLGMSIILIFVFIKKYYNVKSPTKI